MKQLAEDDAAVYNDVKALYESHKDKRTRPTFDELRKILQSEMERYLKTFIIVDALDEISEVDGTRDKLLTTLRSLGSTVNLLATSREPPSPSCHDAKCLEIHASEQDVRRYIEGRLPHEHRLAKHVNGDRELQEEIVKKIIENVKGM